MALDPLLATAKQWSILDLLPRIPALVLAGAEPLGIRRDVCGPSLLDEEDGRFLPKHLKFAFPMPGASWWCNVSRKFSLPLRRL